MDYIYIYIYLYMAKRPNRVRKNRMTKRIKQLRGGAGKGDRYTDSRFMENPIARLQKQIGPVATGDAMDIGIEGLESLAKNSGIEEDVMARALDAMPESTSDEQKAVILMELILKNTPPEQRVGIISGHGEEIEGQFTIVPESMGSFSLYSSSGMSMNATDQWMVNQSSAITTSLFRENSTGQDSDKITPSRFFLRNYEAGALIPDYMVDFDLSFAEKETGEWDYGGVYTENVFDFIMGSTRGYKVGRPDGLKGHVDYEETPFTLDLCLEKHNRERERDKWQIDPYLGTDWPPAGAASLPPGWSAEPLDESSMPFWSWTKPDGKIGVTFECPTESPKGWVPTPGTNFRLSYLFKKIAQAKGPKPNTWFGAFCRSGRSFTIDDLKKCEHEDYGPLPENFFRAKIAQDKEVIDDAVRVYNSSGMYRGYPLTDWTGPRTFVDNTKYWSLLSGMAKGVGDLFDGRVPWISYIDPNLPPPNSEEMSLKRENSLSTNVRTQSFKKMLDDLAQIKEFGETPSDPKFREGIVGIHLELKIYDSCPDAIKFVNDIFKRGCIFPSLSHEHLGEINENIKLALIWVKHFNFTPLIKEEVCFILLLYNKIFTQGNEGGEVKVNALKPSDAVDEIPPEQLMIQFDAPLVSDLREGLVLWDDSVTGSDHQAVPTSPITEVDTSDSSSSTEPVTRSSTPPRIPERSSTPPKRTEHGIPKRSSTPPRIPERSSTEHRIPKRSSTPPKRTERSSTERSSTPPKRTYVPEHTVEPGLGGGGRTKYEEPRYIHTITRPDREFHKVDGLTGVQEHTKKWYGPRTRTGQLYGGKRTPRKKKHNKRKTKKRKTKKRSRR